MKTALSVVVTATSFLMFGCGNSETVTEEQSALREIKNVSSWPGAGQPVPDNPISQLKPSECDGLGGDVDYHASCGKYKLKCTVGDRALCIDELDVVEGDTDDTE